MRTVATPASATEALAMVRAGMSYLSAADATELPTVVQAQCLQELEQVHAVQTAARTSILGAFTAASGHREDACYSPRSWLTHRTRITRGAANAHVAWVRRAAAHPYVAAALGELSESWALQICAWTDQLPEDAREKADKLLVDAALGRVPLRDLAKLAAAIHAKCCETPDPDDPGATLEDRSVRLGTTLDGAGVLAGDLTPECAAVVRTVLDALSAPRGADDTRTHAQRYHDALEEALRRLIAADLLPERAGQAARVWAHVSLADLMVLDGDSKLQQEWTARVHQDWAAARAAASVSGSDGAAWLEGRAARGFTCDASIIPVVTGELNPAALTALIQLCIELAGHGPGRCTPSEPAGSTAACGSEACGCETCGTEAGPGPATEQTTPEAQETTPGAQEIPGPGGNPSGPRPPTDRSPTARGQAALEQAIIGQAVTLVSGPGGLASYLRRGLLGTRLAGPSLPLDIGVSRDIPTAVRRAVILRDQHCRFPANCDQPASACEVHHLTHKANGGKTSVRDCALFCWYHHHIVIHEQGWTVTLNPDGTTTAHNPGKTKTLHSHTHTQGHSPPTARAG